MPTKFQKAKAIFQKYAILEQEIKALANRINIADYSGIFTPDFVKVDIDIKRELVMKIMKFKKEELAILENDFEEMFPNCINTCQLIPTEDWSKLKVTP